MLVVILVRRILLYMQHPIWIYHFLIMIYDLVVLVRHDYEDRLQIHDLLLQFQVALIGEG